MTFPSTIIPGEMGVTAVVTGEPFLSQFSRLQSAEPLLVVVRELPGQKCCFLFETIKPSQKTNNVLFWVVVGFLA